jgi:hypothetical protein
MPTPLYEIDLSGAGTSPFLLRDPSGNIVFDANAPLRRIVQSGVVSLPANSVVGNGTFATSAFVDIPLSQSFPASPDHNFIQFVPTVSQYQGPLMRSQGSSFGGIGASGGWMQSVGAPNNKLRIANLNQATASTFSYIVLDNTVLG